MTASTASDCTTEKRRDTSRSLVRLKPHCNLCSTDHSRTGHYFNESSWYAFNQFTQSDASSGVGCDFYSDPNDDGELGAIVNVYYRNTTSLELQQSWWSYRTNAGWNCKLSALGILISRRPILALLLTHYHSRPIRRRHLHRQRHRHRRDRRLRKGRIRLLPVLQRHRHPRLHRRHAERLRRLQQSRKRHQRRSIGLGVLRWRHGVYVSELDE